MSGKSGKRIVLLAIMLLALVAIDQAVKVIVKTNMNLGQQIYVFGQWFRICFVENNGMAFGMAFGGVVGKYILTACRILLFSLLSLWIVKLSRKSDISTGALVGLTLIDAGALGNIIDCLFYGLIWNYAPFMQGRVVDMLYFPIIRTENFIFFSPVFNIADTCVTVGAIYLILFQRKVFTDTQDKDHPTTNCRP